MPRLHRKTGAIFASCKETVRLQLLQNNYRGKRSNYYRLRILNLVLTVSDKCLTPACEGKVKCRGVCNKCHLTAANMVHKNLTTYDELVALGMLLPKQKNCGGNKTITGLFRKRFEELKRA